MAYADGITVEALETDPYPVYARLRREAPVAYVPAVNAWFVTRWPDVERVGKDTGAFTAEIPSAPVEVSFGKPTILTSEGDVHKGLRGGLESHYRPRPVSAYIDALVRPLANRFADEIEEGGAVDLMSRYFEPISAMALARSLGLADVEPDTLRRWFHGLSQGAINYERDPKRQAISDAVCAEIDGALLPMLERLAHTPDHSPLSHMLHHGMPEGETRPSRHILPTIKITLLGGMQEPGHGAGSVLYGLMSNPDQFTALRAEPEKLIPRAVEEGVRWIAPIGTIFRAAREDIELGGVLLPKGAPVSGNLASANRDESRFASPDIFDINRREHGQAAFGFGPHFCAGKWFALAQMEIAIDVLLKRFPRLALADHAVEFRGWEFRAPQSLLAGLEG